MSKTKTSDWCSEGSISAGIRDQIREKASDLGMKSRVFAAYVLAQLKTQQDISFETAVRWAYDEVVWERNHTTGTYTLSMMLNEDD